MSEMHNFTFVNIKQHLPVFGPLQQGIHIILLSAYFSTEKQP